MGKIQNFKANKWIGYRYACAGLEKFLKNMHYFNLVLRFIYYNKDNFIIFLVAHANCVLLLPETI